MVTLPAFSGVKISTYRTLYHTFAHSHQNIIKQPPHYIFAINERNIHSFKIRTQTQEFYALGGSVFAMYVYHYATFEAAPSTGE